MASPDPQSQPTPAHVQSKASPAVFVILASIWSGLMLTELVNNNILPLTVRHFTDNALVIGIILALHPAFALIAHPIVGIVSDRIWTPLGRRAFIIIVCAPVVAICLFLTPRLGVFWQFVAVVALLQLFQDILWGSDHPLMADILPPNQRTLAKAFTTGSTLVVTFLFLKYGMGSVLPRWGEDSLYTIAAVAQLVLVAGAAFFLRERRIIPAPRPKLTMRRYLHDIFGDRVLRRFTFLAFTHAAFLNVINGFVVLFAVQTLGLAKADFGKIWSIQTIPAIIAVVPLGLLAERIPKQWALVVGYAVALVGCVLGLMAADAGDLVPTALLFGFGALLVEVTQRPFFSEYLPPDLVGQISGAYTACFALGRASAVLLAGALAYMLDNNYRVIWGIALLFGLISLLISATLPDKRYAARRAAGATNGS